MLQGLLHVTYSGTRTNKPVNALSWSIVMIVASYFLFAEQLRSYVTCTTGRSYCSFATTVSQLKMCDFSGETFKGFEVL